MLFHCAKTLKLNCISPVAAKVAASSALGFSDDEEDDGEDSDKDELSQAQREEWRAKQADLSNMRKGEFCDRSVPH